MAGRFGPWTAGQDARVRQMFGAGATDDDIARSVVRTPNAVKKRRLALGLYRGKAPNWGAEDDRDLAEMFESGYTDAEMAEAMGRTEYAVQARRCAMGLRRGGQGSPWDPDDERALARAMCALGERLGRAPRALAYHFIEMGGAVR